MRTWSDWMSFLLCVNLTNEYEAQLYTKIRSIYLLKGKAAAPNLKLTSLYELCASKIEVEAYLEDLDKRNLSLGRVMTT